MAGFAFELVSPEKLLFSGDVEQVVIPGTEGDFAVLKDHAPVISALRPGVLSYKDAKGDKQALFVRGGFADVSAEGLIVLAELAVPVAEMNDGLFEAEVKLANDELRVILVTIHVALKDVAPLITKARVLKTIHLAAIACAAYGIQKPRIAVAGLNPHAGENGMFGQEEIEVIAPAIASARDEGFDASGPYAGDTIFMRARKGEFDIVVAQYHDQGLIPVKYLGIDQGVNVTVGLPFIRTSVDHGTAFDIAGKGIADPSSLRYAFNQALRMVKASAS